MRRILITNDDGIDAEGMQRLVEASKEFGEVWVAAPDGQRSATGHSISLRHSIDVYPAEYPVADVKAFSCSGSPADCVRVACHFLMPEMPDVVLAGINFGYNSATDIQYSGTCGAAFEAAFQGAHAIAVSEAANGVHEVTDRYLKEVLGELLEKPLPYGVIHNVNFPGCPLSECRGILEDRLVSRGMFYRDHYRETEKLPGGGVRWTVQGEYGEEAEEETDLRAIVEGYVSIGRVKNLG